jgi:hypothetical protein
MIEEELPEIDDDDDGFHDDEEEGELGDGCNG